MGRAGKSNLLRFIHAEHFSDEDVRYIVSSLQRSNAFLATRFRSMQRDLQALKDKVEGGDKEKIEAVQADKVNSSSDGKAKDKFEDRDKEKEEAAEQDALGAIVGCDQSVGETTDLNDMSRTIAAYQSVAEATSLDKETLSDGKVKDKFEGCDKEKEEVQDVKVKTSNRWSRNKAEGHHTESLGEHLRKHIYLKFFETPGGLAPSNQPNTYLHPLVTCKSSDKFEGGNKEKVTLSEHLWRQAEEEAEKFDWGWDDEPEVFRFNPDAPAFCPIVFRPGNAGHDFSYDGGYDGSHDGDDDGSYEESEIFVTQGSDTFVLEEEEDEEEEESDTDSNSEFLDSARIQAWYDSIQFKMEQKLRVEGSSAAYAMLDKLLFKLDGESADPGYQQLAGMLREKWKRIEPSR